MTSFHDTGSRSRRGECLLERILEEQGGTVSEPRRRRDLGSLLRMTPRLRAALSFEGSWTASRTFPIDDASNTGIAHRERKKYGAWKLTCPALSVSSRSNSPTQVWHLAHSTPGQAAVKSSYDGHLNRLRYQGRHQPGKGRNGHRRLRGGFSGNTARSSSLSKVRVVLALSHLCAVGTSDESTKGVLNIIRWSHLSIDTFFPFSFFAAFGCSCPAFTACCFSIHYIFPLLTFQILHRTYSPHLLLSRCLFKRRICKTRAFSYQRLSGRAAP